ncbi:MAG: DUF4173 domain-containing protein [Neobacillus sp.]
MEIKIGKTDFIFFLLCLFLGIVAEETFFRGQIGISYFVFIAVFYSIFYWRFRGFSFTHQRLGYLVLICIWLLSASYFIHMNFFFYALNILAIPVLVIFHLVLITSQKSLRWNKPVFVYYIFRRLIESIKYNFSFLGSIVNFLKKGMDESRYEVWKKVLTGVLISIPVLFVVLQLLMSADTQFERLMGEIPQWFQMVDAEAVIRVLAVVFCTFAFFGLMQVLFKKHINAVQQETNNQSSFKIDAIITITVLVLINAVYILFTVVQFKYFFSSSLHGDFTYAEYARKGFFELLFVTLINLSIIIFVLSFIENVAYTIKRLIQSLLTILVLSSAVMLSSAFLRLSMYEEAYGFSFIRVMAHSFMLFLVVIFAYTLIKIWVEKLSLFHFYFISSLLYYTSINMIDIEQIIVTKNIERYETSGKIDLHYFNSLSYTGTLGLIELYDKNKEIPGLKDLLREKKQESFYENDSWQSYNLKRELVNERLKNLTIE